MKRIISIAVLFLSVSVSGQVNPSRHLQVASTALFREVKAMANTKTERNLEKESLITAIINKKFCLLVNSKDTIVLDDSQIPDNPASEIKPFKVKNTSLYCVSWMEKSHAADSLKTEDVTRQCSVICDLKKKLPVMSNFYKTTFISEIVFLNNTQASETREKTRKEGFEFSLETDGSIVLKNSTQQEKMIYDESLGKFIYAGN